MSIQFFRARTDISCKEHLRLWTRMWRPGSPTMRRGVTCVYQQTHPSTFHRKKSFFAFPTTKELSFLLRVTNRSSHAWITLHTLTTLSSRWNLVFFPSPSQRRVRKWWFFSLPRKRHGVFQPSFLFSSFFGAVIDWLIDCDWLWLIHRLIDWLIVIGCDWSTDWVID